MNLHDYLTTQVHRDDPVGDLARDYLEGVRVGTHLPMTTVEALRQHLERIGAWHPALAALAQATHEMEADR